MNRIVQFLIVGCAVVITGGVAQAADVAPGGATASHKIKAPKPPKPVDPGTSATFVLGTISTSNTAVMDFSGTYTCTGTANKHEDTTASMEIKLVQDGRGKLSGEAVLEVKDKATTTIALTGSLQVAKKTGLHVQFGGGMLILDKGTNIISDSDDTYSGATVQVSGDWDGSQFVCMVKVNRDGRGFRLDQSWAPQNTERGFWMEDGAVTPKGKKFVGVRTIHFPWGTDQISISQQNKKGFRFSGKSKTSSADVRGLVNDDGSISVSRARFKAGYTTLDLDPAEVTVLPTQVDAAP